MSATYTLRAAKQTSKTKFNPRLLASLAVAGSAIGFAYNYNNNNKNNKNNNNTFTNKALFGFGASSAITTNVRDASSNKDYEYYQKVYNAIAKKLIDVDDYDYGSYGPLLVRLAWHNSGSYDKNDKTEKKGGSFAGTMRFKNEQGDPANAGLVTGIEFLQSIKDEFPEISHGDLFTLGGVVGIQEMQGPKIPWRPGRIDLPVGVTPPCERLPDATQENGKHIRTVFTERLGFNDEELVALIGVGHSIGRCHVKNSGFDGPWTFSPTTVSNEFFKLLLSEDWQPKRWDGNRQYEDQGSHSLMMLPADMVLKDDSKMRKYVEIYAKDQDKCFKDFASAFSKLLERGIKFNTKPMYFKTLDEQE
jgi:cytochrome c peroxidase